MREFRAKDKKMKKAQKGENKNKGKNRRKCQREVKAVCQIELKIEQWAIIIMDEFGISQIRIG